MNSNIISAISLFLFAWAFFGTGFGFRHYDETASRKVWILLIVSGPLFLVIWGVDKFSGGIEKFSNWLKKN